MFLFFIIFQNENVLILLPPLQIHPSVRNPIQDEPFWGFSRMRGGTKRLPPYLISVKHIRQE